MCFLFFFMPRFIFIFDIGSTGDGSHETVYICLKQLVQW